MKKKHYYKDLFLTTSFFVSWSILVLLYVFSILFPALHVIVLSYATFLGFITFLDVSLLFFTKNGVTLQREINNLLSNGDPNQVKIIVKSSFRIALFAQLIDELPIQFQERDFSIRRILKPKDEEEILYTLTPKQRGEYHFGVTHIFVRSRISFIERRFSAMNTQVVKVYPSFIQLKHLQLKGIPEMQAFSKGQRRFKRGSSTEFDHVKEYNRGDDYRLINWKASARKNELMINAYMDEKSQQIYCILDKGRLMKMPFNKLSLLDYAINASLMFSYVALAKEDKVGLITFAEKMGDILPSNKSRKHFQQIIDLLYRQKTQYLESNFSELTSFVRRKIGQRSLLMLFTNFETYISFERQLPYLKQMNEKHLLCVILFENTEIASLHETRGDSLEDIYIKTIADKMKYEKRMMLVELRKYGIVALHCDPAELSVQAINKYLELKAKNFL
ncbi:MAG: DUF58 domain-containing protein [Chitinophagaceae bacterium]|nr:DUF58 domain-containing protein [Chitinophagaceae bacterium]